MFSIEDFYTGFKTQNGEKIYLGDKLRGDMFYPMLVQYDFKEGKFLVTTTGKSRSPYRSYRIEDVPGMGGVRVISNTLFYSQVKINEKVRITVRNIKDNLFSLGETVKVVGLSEWEVEAVSLNGSRNAILQHHEFLPLWRWDE